MEDPPFEDVFCVGTSELIFQPCSFTTGLLQNNMISLTLFLKDSLKICGTLLGPLFVEATSSLPSRAARLAAERLRQSQDRSGGFFLLLKNIPFPDVTLLVLVFETHPHIIFIDSSLTSYL